ncbi:fimbria/pilus outer membrane usher protein [Aurantiacibacter aquimixticola]|uniref:Fimbrial biogenesis outer membrane usher protein n=1 Tax=Aurantiacibacter aquimixticola TaxID=1958945 RepID=A0A419RTU1_9SPHN|nr:fimbria/pilus outer membrane usher protein [Aurantiacibacter aquimixticola]RJY09200.1 hypothetical protein D6201_07380 [Aurantiacibacter aquimixticola]
MTVRGGQIRSQTSRLALAVAAVSAIAPHILGDSAKAQSIGSPVAAFAIPVHASGATDPSEAVGETGQSTTFTVPLIYGQRALGDVLVRVGRSNDVAIETETFLAEMALLLNDAGLARLRSLTAGYAYFEPERIASLGIDVRFDQRRIALVVGTIPGELRPVQSLGREGRSSIRPNLPVLEPEPFSAYLNIALNQDYQSDLDFAEPEVFLTGATRFNDFVLEYDGAFSDQFGEGHRFYRRGLRAVYDRPEKQQRFTAGDLRAVTLPILRTPFIGGISVEKGRRIFDPFLPVARLGGREIFLDNQSTVEVLLNGDVYQTFQLDPGRYDLSDLPVQTGANDIQLLIRDSAGRRQVIDYQFFYEPLDLPAGESEYSIAVGALARQLTFEPDYSDEFALSAFYRRGMSDSLVLGGGLQASEDVQVAAVTASFVPQIIPGSFDVEAAISNDGEETGTALRANYRFRSGNSFADSKQLTLSVDYESDGYRTLSDIIPIQFDLLTLSANYTHGIDERTFVNAGATYSRIGGDSGSRERTTVFADVVHRLNDRVRLTGGVEYGNSPFLDSDFGVRVGVVMDFGRSHRANVDYRSRTETLRATLSRGIEDEVGAFGYDVGFTDTDGQTSADASVSYIGNRFDARLFAVSSGRNFGEITERQTVRMQVGTSLAFAGGTFGIGRPINDAFAVLSPHPSLENIEVVSGRSLADNRYDARSGLLGGAVQGDLVSYSSQGIQFDAASEKIAIDIGDGVAQVEPPYRAGYAVTVGSPYFAVATGFLRAGEEPVALGVGTITSPDDPEFAPKAFFTNSAGRFAIIGLAPGEDYLITLQDGRQFAISMPDDTLELYRMGDIYVPAEEE